MHDHIVGSTQEEINAKAMEDEVEKFNKDLIKQANSKEGKAVIEKARKQIITKELERDDIDVQIYALH